MLPYFGAGGAEKMVFRLAAGMDQTRYHIEVFCVYGQPQKNSMEEILCEKGIKLHHIGKKLGFSPKAVRKLFQSLDHFAPDLIHTHMYACVYAALWPLIRNKPFLHTFHTLPEVENARLTRRLLTRWLVSRNRMIPVAISEGNQRMVADYYHVSADRVPMVHNPVDVRRFAAGKRTEDGVFRWPDVALEIGGFSEGSFFCKVFAFVRDFLLKHADLVTTVSPGKVRKLRGHAPGAEICFVPNGLDERFLDNEFHPETVGKYGLDAGFNCVYIGSFGRAQGLMQLMHLAERAKEKNLDARFVLFGNGVEEESLRRYAADLLNECGLGIAVQPNHDDDLWNAFMELYSNRDQYLQHCENARNVILARYSRQQAAVVLENHLERIIANRTHNTVR